MTTTKKKSTKPEVSDAAVLEATGKSTAHWFKVLDARAKAKGGHTHKDAASHLAAEHGCTPWWSQMVTVLYERDRGLRDKHQRPDGYSISVSRTLPVSIARLYRAWGEGERTQWLPDPLVVRKATKDRSMRITWDDGTNVEVMFYAKGDMKSQVTVQHSKLKSAAAGTKAKAAWGAALDRLSQHLGV